MRLFHKILFLAVSILTVINLSAQEFYRSINPITTEANSLNYKLSGRQYFPGVALRGTIYLSDFWSDGTVILENGDRYDDVTLKLNLVDDELIRFNKRTGAMTVLDKFTISEFILRFDNSDSLLFRKLYFDKYPKGEHYFNICYDGTVKLLIWYRTIEANTSLYRDVYGYLRDKEYEQQINYFILFPDNNMVKIKGSRKSFIELFPEQKKTVRQLFRKNNIVLYDRNKSEIIRATKLIEAEFFSK